MSQTTDQDRLFKRLKIILENTLNIEFTIRYPQSTGYERHLKTLTNIIKEIFSSYEADKNNNSIQLDVCPSQNGILLVMWKLSDIPFIYFSSCSPKRLHGLSDAITSGLEKLLEQLRDRLPRNISVNTDGIDLTDESI